MFDIGFLELLMVSVVGLLVLGPDRLPGAIRTVSLYVNKIRRSFNSIRTEIERELKTDEIRQDLHNQSIMKDLRKAEKELRKGLGVDGSLLGKDGYPLDKDDPVGAPGAAGGAKPGTAPSADTTPQASAEPKPPSDTAKS